MEFTVEYYETVAGRCPVREFLDELEASDPDDFAAVFAGMEKLRSRQTHREPLTKALGDGLFELRHVGNMKKTNFDLHLEEQLRDPVFAERFKRAGEAWDVALQISALREKAGLSQKDLARKLKTSQQQISRLESPDYEGHSLANLRRVAKVLHARVRVVFEADEKSVKRVAQPTAPYRVKRAAAK